MDPENPFQQLEELFRAGKPKESQKRQRRPSKRALVGRLLPDIERLLDEGYSFVGIAGYFVDLGLRMPVTTLKNYVARARRDLARSSGKGKPHKASRRMAPEKRHVELEKVRRSTTRSPGTNRHETTVAPAPPHVSVIVGQPTPGTPPEHARGTPVVPSAPPLPVGVGFIPRNR